MTTAVLVGMMPLARSMNFSWLLEAFRVCLGEAETLSYSLSDSGMVQCDAECVPNYGTIHTIDRGGIILLDTTERLNP